MFKPLKRNSEVNAAAFPGIRAAVKDSELTIEVYGVIGMSFWEDGITASQVSEQLSAAAGKASSVKVRINSPGGSCFEGVTIYNLLRSCGLPVTTVVDGLAASAASIIAMAGDKIQMGQGTMLMIHPAWMMAAGSADDLRKEADILDKITGQMVGIYAKRSGQKADAIAALVALETWMTPDEALEIGFADEMTDEQGDTASVAAAFDLSIFAHTPESLITAPTTAAAEVEASEALKETAPDAGEAEMLRARKRLLDLY
jgi:ATP-dependent Clp protease, protease subunit